MQDFPLPVQAYFYFSTDSIEHDIAKYATGSINSVCTFNRLPGGEFYILLRSIDSLGVVYEKIIEIEVPPGRVLYQEEILLSKGNIEVFVRQSSLSGPYIGNALVLLYYPFYNVNGGPCDLAITPYNNPEINGAFFKNLDSSSYFIDCEFSDPHSTYYGVDEVYVTKGVTTKYHLVCK